MKQKINNKGEMSLIIILLVMISMYFIAGYYNAIKTSYVMDEIQSSLDITGVATLERLLNYELLKDEIYGLNHRNKMDYTGLNKKLNDYENQIKSIYRSALSFNKRLIPQYQINSQDVYFENTKWGTGNSAKFSGYRPQIVIETVMKLNLNISRGHDYRNVLVRNFYSSKKNKNMQILSIGSTNDGRTELIIRSTVRNIYN